MNKELYFELPTDREKTAQVIDSIPNTWACISGCLTATRQHYENDLVAPNTRLVLSRFKSDPHFLGIVEHAHEDEPEITGHPQYCQPHVHDVMFSGKQVSSIALDDYGFEHNSKKIDFAKQLICEYVKLGYQGYIAATSKFFNNRYSDYAAAFFLSPGNTRAYFCRPVMPPHLRVVWDPDTKTGTDDVAGLITLIESLEIPLLPEHEGDQ